MRMMRQNISEDFLDVNDPSELLRTVDVLPEEPMEHDDFTDVEP